VRQQRQSVWLEVRAGNQEAQALYRRHGFVVTGVRPKYYPAREGREDAVLMSLTLPARSAQEVV
jgi:ribosomal-protein-alanine N-acetyltransferase